MPAKIISPLSLNFLNSLFLILNSEICIRKIPIIKNKMQKPKSKKETRPLRAAVKDKKIIEIADNKKTHKKNCGILIID